MAEIKRKKEKEKILFHWLKLRKRYSMRKSVYDADIQRQWQEVRMYAKSIEITK